MQSPMSKDECAHKDFDADRDARTGHSVDADLSEATKSPRKDSSPLRAAGLEPDPVIEAYKRHIDRKLLRENLRRTVTERVANLIALQRLEAEARRAACGANSKE